MAKAQAIRCAALKTPQERREYIDREVPNKHKELVKKHVTIEFERRKREK